MILEGKIYSSRGWLFQGVAYAEVEYDGFYGL